jgi:hypothetical protein
LILSWHLVIIEYPLIYIPKKEDEVFDIDIVATPQKLNSYIGNDVIFQIISKITWNSIDLVNSVLKYDFYGKDSENLKQIISNFLSIPKE